MSSVQEEIQALIDIGAKVAAEDEVRSVRVEVNDLRNLFVAFSTAFGLALERITALEGGVVTTPAPTPAPAPVPVDPPGSVRWRGALWTISTTGQILRDGVVIPETAKTSGVVRVWVGADGLLWQQNSAGDQYRWTGAADWERMPVAPTVTITASGSIGA